MVRPLARLATPQTAWKRSAHAGFDDNDPSSALPALASWHVPRPASRALKLNHFRQNAAHGGLSQRFLSPCRLNGIQQTHGHGFGAASR